jgi:hypothetical protein
MGDLFDLDDIEEGIPGLAADIKDIISKGGKTGRWDTGVWEMMRDHIKEMRDEEDKLRVQFGLPVSVGGSRRVKSSKQVKDIFFEQIRNTQINIPDKVIEKLWKDLSSKGIFISSKGGNTVKRNNRKKYKTKKSRCKKTRRKYH